MATSRQKVARELNWLRYRVVGFNPRHVASQLHILVLHYNLEARSPEAVRAIEEAKRALSSAEDYMFSAKVKLDEASKFLKEETANNSKDAP